LPILLYATESINLPHADLAELNACWNSVYRKIFGYHKWESVRALIGHLGRLDYLHINNLKTTKFILKMLSDHSAHDYFKEYLMNTYLASSECFKTFSKYGCSVNLNAQTIHKNIYRDFNIACLN